MLPVRHNVRGSIIHDCLVLDVLLVYNPVRANMGVV